MSAIRTLKQHGVTDITVLDTPEEAVTRLSALYEDEVKRMLAVAEAMRDGKSLLRHRLLRRVAWSTILAFARQFIAWLLKRSWKESFEWAQGRYPIVAIEVTDEEVHVDPSAAYGFCRNGPGLYYTTVTRLDLFRGYLLHNLELLQKAHPGIRFIVGLSSTRIPLHFVADVSKLAKPVQRAFQRPDVAYIGRSNKANGWGHPLAHFSAVQTDFALNRLAYYTGTSPTAFQRFVLFTNYDMYVDAFRAWARDQVGGPDGYTEFIQPRALDLTGEHANRKRPQMPAYHLVRPDGTGITLVHIGVGPSNTLTMMRCLAVLRPHAVIMVGHCGGLRQTQSIGGFVLGEGYFRRDHVLDDLLATDIPIPPIAEINRALWDAVRGVTELSEEEVKKILERGTVATTTNRWWEVDESQRAEIILSRALAVDMESATLAAAAFLWSIPYGILLKISDLPLHGEVKLEGMAHAFFSENVDAHLMAAVTAISTLRANAAALVSRKLFPVDGKAFA